MRAFPEAYHYEHEPLGRAVDGDAGFGFSISLDRGVVPKRAGPHGDQADAPPSTTLALTYFVFERPEDGFGGGMPAAAATAEPRPEGVEGATSPPGGGAAATATTTAAAPAPSSHPPPRITDIFCQRELSWDEACRKMGAPPAVAAGRVLDAVPLDLLQFGAAGEHSAERAAAHAVAAEAVNEAWRTGDASSALPHLAPNFVRINALTGAFTRGPEGFARMLSHVFERYELLWHSSAVAVTPGSKVGERGKGRESGPHAWAARRAACRAGRPSESIHQPRAPFFLIILSFSPPPFHSRPSPSSRPPRSGRLPTAASPSSCSRPVREWRERRERDGGGGVVARWRVFSLSSLSILHPRPVRRAVSREN